MAEFGIKATQLTDPQGAGSQPIRPVQGPAGFSPDLSGLGGLLTGLVSKKQERTQADIELDRYTSMDAKITQLQQTGEYTNARAKIEREKLYNQFRSLGADNGFGVDFQKTLSNLRGYGSSGTGADDADNLVREENKAKQELLLEAQKNGLFQYVTNFQDLGAEQQQALLNSQQSVRYAEAEAKRTWEERQKLQSMESHGVAMTKADREARDYQLQQEARRAAGPMMRDAYGLIDAQLSGIMSDASLDPTQKAATFLGSVTNIRSKMYEALQGDPQTFQAVNQTLNDLEKMGKDLLDPAKRTEALENEFKRRMAEAKNWAIDGTNAVRAAALASIYPNSPSVQMMVANVGMAKFNENLLASENAKPLPAVVTGDTQAQKAVFGATREAIRRATDGQSYEAEKTLNAAAQTMSSAVKSLSSFRPGQSNTMEYVLEAIASPENGVLISQGKFNKQDGREAMDAITQVYVPAFTEQLRGATSVPVGDTRYENGTPSADSASLMQLIDFSVNADGQVQINKNIHPDFRKQITGSDLYIDGQISKLKKSLEPKINQLIRATAHLEGTTDYKAVFERVAPTMLRGFYAPADYMEQLKAQGYSGTGNVNNPANWKGTSGFPSQRNESDSAE